MRFILTSLEINIVLGWRVYIKGVLVVFINTNNYFILNTINIYI